jgi:uncharacterized protein DUF6573
VVDHPLLGETEILSVYLRQQAFADGVLVDCTQQPFDSLNRQAGIIFDVAMTRAVFERYVEVPRAHEGSQDIKGRYWDILTMFRHASAKQPDVSELVFELLSIPNGAGMLDNEKLSSPAPDHYLVQLKAVTGPGDYGEPWITFMLPDED